MWHECCMCSCANFKESIWPCKHAAAVTSSPPPP
ncbi:MAG: SWIM zinc finger family protein [Myxococcales bacterium]|nr:SWIM zinc finger family protein [Myxococcales bacterium]MCB9708564.1 SWIM zinc finger family protein [Myxococcales bacterium]